MIVARPGRIVVSGLSCGVRVVKVDWRVAGLGIVTVFSTIGRVDKCVTTCAKWPSQNLVFLAEIDDDHLSCLPSLDIACQRLVRDTRGGRRVGVRRGVDNARLDVENVEA